MTAGVDVWLNTPAAADGGLRHQRHEGRPQRRAQLSILDGWWIEGCIEGVTGWAIGAGRQCRQTADATSAADAASLYDKLEQVVVPLFYSDRDRFLNVMRHAIALNGSFFNTQRMVQQYVLKAYFE